MKKAFAAGAILFFFTCSSIAADGDASSGCTVGKSAAGAGIGVLIGTLIFPGVGTMVGAALFGGGTCAYGWFKS